MMDCLPRTRSGSGPRDPDLGKGKSHDYTLYFKLVIIWFISDESSVELALYLCK